MDCFWTYIQNLIIISYICYIFDSSFCSFTKFFSYSYIYRYWYDYTLNFCFPAKHIVASCFDIPTL